MSPGGGRTDAPAHIGSDSEPDVQTPGEPLARPPDEPHSGTGPSSAAINLPLDVRNVALTIIATLALLAAARIAAGLLIPVVLCILVAYALAPVASAFERIGVARWLASGLVVGGVISSVAAGALWLSSDIADAINRLPDATARIRDELGSAPNSRSAMQSLGEAAENIEAAAAGAPGESSPRAASPDTPALRLRDALAIGPLGILGFTGQFLLFTVFVYFILASGNLFKRKLVHLAGPTLARRRVTVEALDEINAVIARFLLVVVATSGVVTIATWLAFRAIGLSNAFVWSLLGGVLNVVPYFGPLLAAGVYFVVGFLQFETIEMALLASGLFVAVTSIEGNWLKPQLLSRTARLNNVAVFASLLFWGWLWGAWGLLLAFPILVVVKVVADRVDQFKGVGELLGE